MKKIVAAFVALSFVAAAISPAAAAPFGGSAIERLDKQGRGGHAT